MSSSLAILLIQLIAIPGAFLFQLAEQDNGATSPSS